MAHSTRPSERRAFASSYTEFATPFALGVCAVVIFEHQKTPIFCTTNLHISSSIKWLHSTHLCGSTLVVTGSNQALWLKAGTGTGKLETSNLREPATNILSAQHVSSTR